MDGVTVDTDARETDSATNPGYLSLGVSYLVDVIVRSVCVWLRNMELEGCLSFILPYLTYLSPLVKTTSLSMLDRA